MGELPAGVKEGVKGDRAIVEGTKSSALEAIPPGLRDCEDRRPEFQKSTLYLVRRLNLLGFKEEIMSI